MTTFTAQADATALARALSMAARVSPKGGAGPAIVLNLKLAARDGKLVVSGTNMDASIEIAIDAEASGETTAPAAQLAAIGNKLDSGKPVSLSIESDMLVIKQGRTSFKLPTLPASDLPIPMTADEPARVTALSATLSAALKMVEGATADDMVTKAHLSGVYFDASKGDIVLTGLDKAHLSASPLGVEAPKDMHSVIVPPAALPMILVLCGQGAEVTLAVTRHSFGVEVGGVKFETKVIDADFPDWRRLPRKKHASVAQVNGADLRRVLDKVTAIGPARLIVELGDSVSIEAQAMDRRLTNAGAADVVEHIAMTGPHVRIALDSDQAKWIVSSLPNAEVIEIGAMGALDSVAFIDPARPHDARLLMPLRG